MSADYRPILGFFHPCLTSCLTIIAVFLSSFSEMISNNEGFGG